MRRGTFYRTGPAPGNVLLDPAPETVPAKDRVRVIGLVNYLERDDRATGRDRDLREWEIDRVSDRPVPAIDRGSGRQERDHRGTARQVRGRQVTGRRVTGLRGRATCRTTVEGIGDVVRTGAGAGTISDTTGGPGQPPAR